MSGTNLRSYKFSKGANNCESVRFEIAPWRRKKSIFSIIIVTTINITSELKLKFCKWKELCWADIFLQVLTDVWALKLSYVLFLKRMKSEQMKGIPWQTRNSHMAIHVPLLQCMEILTQVAPQQWATAFPSHLPFWPPQKPCHHRWQQDAGPPKERKLHQAGPLNINSF